MSKKCTDCINCTNQCVCMKEFCNVTHISKTLHPALINIFMQNSLITSGVGSSLQPTCVAVREVSGDDLLLAAIRKLFVPGHLHHLLPLLHLVVTGEPRLTLCQGAQGGDGLRGLHEITVHAYC